MIDNSPLRSHGTVRESLPSYGSSCLITNVFLHLGYANINWLWSRFIVIDLPSFWLSISVKLNRLSPSLHYLSVTSSLLQLSPSLLSHVILTCRLVLQLILTIAISLVPYKNPCWCPASFTPDVMQSAIRSSIAFLTDVNVITCFQHRLFYITRLQSLVHSIRLFNSHLQESSFP